jgi:hypothetical protein
LNIKLCQLLNTIAFLKQCFKVSDSYLFEMVKILEVYDKKIIEYQLIIKDRVHFGIGCSKKN